MSEIPLQMQVRLRMKEGATLTMWDACGGCPSSPRLKGKPINKSLPGRCPRVQLEEMCIQRKEEETLARGCSSAACKVTGAERSGCRPLGRARRCKGRRVEAEGHGASGNSGAGKERQGRGEPQERNRHGSPTAPLSREPPAGEPGGAAWSACPTEPTHCPWGSEGPPSWLRSDNGLAHPVPMASPSQRVTRATPLQIPLQRTRSSRPTPDWDVVIDETWRPLVTAASVNHPD